MSQTPIEADRTCDIDSVTSRNPEGSVSVTIIACHSGKSALSHYPAWV